MSLNEINETIQFLQKEVKKVDGTYLKVELYERLNHLNAQALRIKKGLV